MDLNHDMGVIAKLPHYYPYCPPVDNLSLIANETRSPDDIAVEKVENVLYGILMPVLSALGIVGNILNLVVLTRPNLMKIITYTYFRAMAISDLLTMLMVIPFVAELSGAAISGYAGTLFHAHVVLPCLNALVGSSVLCIVAVTFERWLSICHPLQAKNIQSPLRAKIIIAMGWVISFSLYVPYCLRKYVNICTDPTSREPVYAIVEDVAFTHSKGYMIYGWVRETMLRLLPMGLLAILNLRIVFALRQVHSRRRKLKGKPVVPVFVGSTIGSTKKKDTDELSTHDAHTRHSISSTPAAKAEFRRLQEERRLVLLLIGIVIMFFVCITPAAILLILPIPDEEFGFGLKLFRAVANLLELTNYALNFYVYVGCSSDFRTTFANVFCSHLTKRMHAMNGDASAYERSMLTTTTKAGGGGGGGNGDHSRKSTLDMTASAVTSTGCNTPAMRARNENHHNNNSSVAYQKVVTISDGPEQQELLQVEEVCV